MPSAKNKSEKMIKVGQPAPDFNLPKPDGTFLSLKELTGKQVVLFFYPKDSTPGCTIEARGFSASLPKFERRNTVVIGISGGTTKTKTAFCQKFQLRQIMLSDTDFKTATAYNSYGEKSFMGRKFMGILRKTFVIGTDGKICKIFDKVNPEEHAQEVLAFITELNGGALSSPSATQSRSINKRVKKAASGSRLGSQNGTAINA